MYEYFLKFWGGAEEIIEKELGFKGECNYFETKEERDIFINKIRKYKHLGLVLDTMEGEMTHEETIVKMDLIYEDKAYPIIYNFGYEYPRESAEFMFFNGNYSCDCNLSMFIQRQCDEQFHDMCCGGRIKINNFRFA